MAFFWGHQWSAPGDRSVRRPAAPCNSGVDGASTVKCSADATETSVVRSTRSDSVLKNDVAGQNATACEEKNRTGNVNYGAGADRDERITAGTKSAYSDEKRAGCGDRHVGQRNTGPSQRMGRRHVTSGEAGASQNSWPSIQSPDASEPALVTCRRCGALIEDGVDCDETLDCPGEPDKDILAVYQPVNGREYDPGNSFDRTNLALAIYDRLHRTEDFLSLNESLFISCRKTAEEYERDRERALYCVRLHQRALGRLKALGGC